jgi:hypothetical protein
MKTKKEGDYEKNYEDYEKKYSGARSHNLFVDFSLPGHGSGFS